MPSKWQSIIIRFSTYHLTDTRTGFQDVMNDSDKTLGRYLHNSALNPYLRKVPIVCFNDMKDDLYNNRNQKRSLEYQLSLKYKYAYVDLKGYRNDSSIQKKPFYLRPTFDMYKKMNWEDIYDGLLFVRDCGCKK